ncbi:hypothetical protein SCLCIDRAFT_26835 [Scleroderma citrinum Foug A]|uniref:Uncharacterized protein n=1 Tax=Scleroderma citrinum Foug A TaxID=1036808 RepID=A0A0C3DHM4_9AGAM|nr:hypothetical protein SCLCIDRAFT_26835 [Scleroderma citrinum Foug A]
MDLTLNWHASLYCRCRQQMAALGTNADILIWYQELHASDLSVTTAISNPNARGHHDDRLAWFWTMDVPHDTDRNNWMSECMCYTLFWNFHSTYCHDHANSIPIWTNSTLLLVYSDIPTSYSDVLTPTPTFLLLLQCSYSYSNVPTSYSDVPTPTPTSSLSVPLLSLLQVHTPFPSVTYLSVCHPPSSLPLPCVFSFSYDTPTPLF